MTPSDQSPSDRIRELFVEALNIEVPSAETDLIESGLLDSLALVELLFEIERRFEVDLSLDELEIENFRTVDRISQFITSQRKLDSSSAVG